jgi:hypothetical protein
LARCRTRNPGSASRGTAFPDCAIDVEATRRTPALHPGYPPLRRNLATTSSGTAAAFNFFGSAGSATHHTRVCVHSTATAPFFVRQCLIAKLERFSEAIVE